MSQGSEVLVLMKRGFTDSRLRSNRVAGDVEDSVEAMMRTG